jgi:hypothetical protein
MERNNSLLTYSYEAQLIDVAAGAQSLENPFKSRYLGFANPPRESPLSTGTYMHTYHTYHTYQSQRVAQVNLIISEYASLGKHLQQYIVESDCTA